MIFVLKMLFTFVCDPKNENHWHYSLFVTHYSTRNTKPGYNSVTRIYSHEICTTNQIRRSYKNDQSINS